MASSQFPHLFSPLTIGSITVQNRIVFPPIGTRRLEDASLGDACAPRKLDSAIRVAFRVGWTL